ncbi:class III signal peptide-containing protein [Methanobacterium sp. BAmetb5]|jgi:hypothetical protein|uniref:class III signal peptide-containing protein n=1 Tax=Methanobacterium sp. BAmetb5 TaxID=2025351 RepID=UPI0025E15895|nr:class III signal peptide-containing protein [Methanobacterium sp. BAmetb5]
MDSRGQLSAEYILLVGFVLAVVLIFAWYVSDQSEQNVIATAVRVGASNASAEIGIMNTTTTPIRVNKVDMTSGEKINITIFLSNTALSPQQRQTILGGVEQSIESAGYTVNSQIDPVSNTVNTLTIDTSKHDYLIKIS